MPGGTVEQTVSRSHALRGSLKSRKATPEAVEATRAELKALSAESYIARLVDQAPPLTEVQRARLAALLLGARRTDEAVPA
jgi:hypothetical protein